MTAVEFIKEELNRLGLLDKGQVMTNLFKQAKEMEKQQIINDYFQGVCDESDSHGAQSLNMKDAENYYNAKYGSKGSD